MTATVRFHLIISTLSLVTLLLFLLDSTTMVKAEGGLSMGAAGPSPLTGTNKKRRLGGGGGGGGPPPASAAQSMSTSPGRNRHSTSSQHFLAHSLPPETAEYPELWVMANGSDAGECGTRVHPCRNIANAVHLAPPQTTIYVTAGRYACGVHITKPIRLLGTGPGWPVMDCQSRNRALFFDGVPGHVEGFKFLNGYAADGGCVLVRRRHDDYNESNTFVKNHFEGCTAYPSGERPSGAGALAIQYDWSYGRTYHIQKTQFIDNYARSDTRFVTGGMAIDMRSTLPRHIPAIAFAFDKFEGGTMDEQSVKHKVAGFFGLYSLYPVPTPRFSDSVNHRVYSTLPQGETVSPKYKRIKWLLPCKSEMFWGIVVTTAENHTGVEAGRLPPVLEQQGGCRCVLCGIESNVQSPDQHTSWSLEHTATLDEPVNFIPQHFATQCPDAFLMGNEPRWSADYYVRVPDVAEGGRPVFKGQAHAREHSVYPPQWIWYTKMTNEWLVTHQRPGEYQKIMAAVKEKGSPTMAAPTLRSTPTHAIHPGHVQTWRIYNNRTMPGAWVNVEPARRGGTVVICPPEPYTGPNHHAGNEADGEDGKGDSNSKNNNRIDGKKSGGGSSSASPRSSSSATASSLQQQQLQHNKPTPQCKMLQFANPPQPTSDVFPGTYLLTTKTWAGRPVYTSAAGDSHVWYCACFSEWAISGTHPDRFTDELKAQQEADPSYDPATARPAIDRRHCVRALSSHVTSAIQPTDMTTWAYTRRRGGSDSNGDIEWLTASTETGFKCVDGCKEFTLHRGGGGAALSGSAAPSWETNSAGHRGTGIYQQVGTYNGFDVYRESDSSREHEGRSSSSSSGSPYILYRHVWKGPKEDAKKKSNKKKAGGAGALSVLSPVVTWVLAEAAHPSLVTDADVALVSHSPVDHPMAARSWHLPSSQDKALGLATFPVFMCASAQRCKLVTVDHQIGAGGGGPAHDKHGIPIMGIAETRGTYTRVDLTLARRPIYVRRQMVHYENTLTIYYCQEMQKWAIGPYNQVRALLMGVPGAQCGAWLASGVTASLVPTGAAVSWNYFFTEASKDGTKAAAWDVLETEVSVTCVSDPLNTEGFPSGKPAERTRNFADNFSENIFKRNYFLGSSAGHFPPRHGTSSVAGGLLIDYGVHLEGDEHHGVMRLLTFKDNEAEASAEDGSHLSSSGGKASAAWGPGSALQLVATGGLSLRSGGWRRHTATMNDMTFAANHAGVGGMTLQGVAALIMTSNFKHNSGAVGGGAMHLVSSEIRLTSRSECSHNIATYSGGCINLDDQSYVRVKDVTFRRNQAGKQGTLSGPNGWMRIHNSRLVELLGVAVACNALSLVASHVECARGSAQRFAGSMGYGCHVEADEVPNPEEVIQPGEIVSFHPAKEDTYISTLAEGGSGVRGPPQQQQGAAVTNGDSAGAMSPETEQWWINVSWHASYTAQIMLTITMCVFAYQHFIRVPPTAVAPKTTRRNH